MEKPIIANTQKKYHTIIFDVDGTLLDSYPGITKGAQYALKHFGVDIEDASQLKHFVGPPLEETFYKDFGFEGETLHAIIDKFREYFQSEGFKQQSPYPGTIELVKELCKIGVKVAIATSKPEKFAKIIIGGYGILDCFSGFAGSTLDRSRVHKNDVLEHLIRELNDKDLDGMLMVGDREHDLMAAQKCGIDSVGVLYGYGSREELEEYNPTFLADDVVSLREFILTHI